MVLPVLAMVQITNTEATLVEARAGDVWNREERGEI